MERRRARSRESPRARAAAALALSALVNAAGLALAGAAGAFVTAPRTPATARVSLAAVPAEAWDAHRRVAAAAPLVAPAAPLVAPAAPHAAPPPARDRPRPRPPDPAGLLVRVAPAPDRRRPDRARFLAERDGVVERETRWRGPRPLERVAALSPRPVPGAPGAGGAAGGAEGSADEVAPGRRGDPGAASRLAAARRALAAPGVDLSTRAPAVLPAPSPAAAGAGGEGGASQRGSYDPRLLPVADGRARPGGGAPSGDPLPGVADGDATLVNTRAFRFAGFYRRVHDAISGEWRPNRVWDARDPHDRLLGRTRRQVEVDIVLDADGRLRDLRLLRGSGLAFFDAECLRAIRAAAPFPNPPRGLVGPDGLVALRGWRLVLDFGPEDVLDRWLPGR